MKEQFTPGPWEVVNVTHVFTEEGATRSDGVKAADDDRWHIADCAMGVTSDSNGGCSTLKLLELAANAHLITAAPDMYAALNRMCRNAIELGYCHILDCRICPTMAALKKARGEA